MSGIPFKNFISKTVDGQNLTEDESARAFQIIMSGGATPAQMSAFLVSMRIKGETIDEITGAAQTIRQKAIPFNAPDNAIDTCGTGGDSSGTYNISTAAAIVTAACGVPVVKHGSRAVSSKSGSADVMRELGVNLVASEKFMQKALDECGLCFLIAPAYHKAMRHISPVRQDIGIRTIFNLLGPLSNPAGVKNQLLGVYSEDLIIPLAEVLKKLGTKHAWIVHGNDGLDEISLTAPTKVGILKDGDIKLKEICPQDAGLEFCKMDELKGGNHVYNAKALNQLLAGQQSAYRDITCLNVAAALIVSGKTDNLTTGVKIAEDAIDNSSAREVLNKLIEITNLELLDDDNG